MPRLVAFGLASLPIAVAGCVAASPGEQPVPGVLPWDGSDEPLAPAGAVSGRVEAIIDGDTIALLLNGQRVTVRLLGIDTPEKSGGPRPAECFGAEASRFLGQLLPLGSTVSVSRDHESRDQYGRLLAWIHRTDGVFVNLAVVESGHATALFFAPNTTLEPLFQQAAFTARRERRGFWDACGGPDVVL